MLTPSLLKTTFVSTLHAPVNFLQHARFPQHSAVEETYAMVAVVLVVWKSLTPNYSGFLFSLP